MDEFPQFELAGLPCEAEGCSGVLVDTVTIVPPLEFFRRCASCGATFHRMAASDKLAWAKRTIDAALKGARPS